MKKKNLTKEERIRQELKGQPTGFDVLLDKKRLNLRKVEWLLHKFPKITREEMADVLEISVRSVSRYMAELRKTRKAEFSASILQKREKQKRLAKLEEILHTSPWVNRTELSHKLEISKRTLRRYLNERN